MYFWLGVNAPGVMEAPGNHSPYFVVDDGALNVGLKALVYLVLDYPKK
jgi:amidohydrolase